MSELWHQMPSQEVDAVTGSADFATYLDIIRRRKWFVIASLFISILPIGLIISLVKPTYEATATLVIQPVNPKIVQFEEVVGPDRSSEYFQTQHELLQSRAMAEIVIDTLQARSGSPGKIVSENQMLTAQEAKVHQPEKSQSDSFLYKNILDSIMIAPERLLQYIKEMIGINTDVLSSESTEVERYRKIKELMKSTRVSSIIGTRLVNITISGPDPYEITNQVNTLTEVFVAQNLENKLEASKQASVWLKNEVSNLKKGMQDAEFILLDFVKSHEFTPPEETQNNGNDRSDKHIEELKVNLRSAKAQRLELEHRLKELKSSVELVAKRQRPLVSALDIPAVSNLQAQYLDAESELKTLSERFKESHPKIMDIDSQMTQIKYKIILAITDQIEKFKFEVSLIRDKENSIERTLIEETLEKTDFYKNKIIYETLKRDIDNKRYLYETMLKRLNETEVTKGLETNNIMISQKAVVPIEPIPSRKKKLVAGSIMLFLATGVGLAFFFERIDKRFHKPDEAEQYVKIPSLGTIPRNKAKDINFRHEFINPNRSYLTFPNAYRQLRTNIQFRSVQKDVRTLLVTSSIPGEGKSTTVTNLGLSFGQLGKSVLLVDADLRHPTLHKNFDLPNTFGLNDILTGGIAWERCIQHTEIENIKVMTNGSKLPNPVELLSMRKMKKLCEELKDKFDLIIYDTSSVLGIPDACILAMEMDAVLLIHNSEFANREMLLEAKSNLETANANILGFVFNNTKDTVRSSRYYTLNYNGNDITAVDTNLHSVQIKENENDKTINININQAFFREEMEGDLVEEGFVFLIIELEVSNSSNFPFVFEHRCANICLKQASKYGNAVRSIYDFSDNSNLPNYLKDFIFFPHHLTKKIQNGLKDEEVISSHETVIGKIIYKVPYGKNQYLFSYKNININTSTHLVF